MQIENVNNLSPTKVDNEENYYNKANSKTDWELGNLLKIKNFINDLFSKREKLKMLEVGCGEAAILNHINKEIYYEGVDPSEYCNKVVDKSERANIQQGLAENLPFGDEQFDVVFSNHALEHFFDPKKSLEEMGRVLKKDGYLILFAPNHELPWTLLNATRHYKGIKLTMFNIKRIIDLFKRMFGVQVFRVIPDNYTSSTKKYERPDDDLIYVTSSYEVLNYFLAKDFSKVYPESIAIESNNKIKNVVKNILKLVPSLKYSSTNLFFILKK